MQRPCVVLVAGAEQRPSLPACYMLGMHSASLPLPPSAGFKSPTSCPHPWLPSVPACL